MDEKDYRLVKIFDVLGNGVRLQIVKLLLEDVLTVGELAGKLDRSVSSVSHHLRTLRDVNLVQGTTVGQSVEYEAKRPELIESLLDHRNDVRRDEVS